MYADGGHGGAALGPMHVLRVAVLQDLFAAQSAGADRQTAIATGLRLHAVLDATGLNQVCVCLKPVCCAPHALQGAACASGVGAGQALHV